MKAANGGPQWLTIFGLFLATGLVITLSMQVRVLRSEIANIRVRAMVMPQGSLAPIMTTETLDGGSLQLGPSEVGAQLYFVYNTSCPHCIDSMRAWSSLAQRFGTTAGVRIIGITLASAPEALVYEGKHPLPFHRIALLDERARDSYRFGVVPQTIVLDSDARIAYSRPGVLPVGPATDSIVEAVERLLLKSDEAAERGSGV